MIFEYWREDFDYWRDMYCAAIESTFQFFLLSLYFEAVERGEDFEVPTPKFIFPILCDCCCKSVNVAEVVVCWECGRVECWECCDNDEGASWKQCEVCYRRYCDCDYDYDCGSVITCDRCDDSADEGK